MGEEIALCWVVDADGLKALARLCGSGWGKVSAVVLRPLPHRLTSTGPKNPVKNSVHFVGGEKCPLQGGGFGTRLGFQQGKLASEITSCKLVG